MSASTDDDAYGATASTARTSQNVTAGRIFVGKAPWAGGIAGADDGQGHRAPSATLKVKIAAPGKRKLAYVQGRDAAGEWGPATPVWLPKR